MLRAHTVPGVTRRPADGVPRAPLSINGFYFNPWTPKIAKTLVCAFELLLVIFYVIPIVAQADCIM
jgi:hypothetical protein